MMAAPGGHGGDALALGGEPGEGEDALALGRVTKWRCSGPGRGNGGVPWFWEGQQRNVLALALALADQC